MSRAVCAGCMIRPSIAKLGRFVTASGIDLAAREAGAGQGALAALGEPDQAELFAEIAEQERAALDQPLRPWTGKGRKPGSRNVTTRTVIEYIQKIGRDPLLALHSVVQMTPAEVKNQFGFEDPDKAAEFWRKCCAELAPYMHSRQPQALVLAPEGAFAPIFLQFAAAAPAAPPTLEARAQSEQFQHLSDEARAQVAWSQGRMDDPSD